MQNDSPDTFQMPNGVIVNTDFEDFGFVMNPKTEELIRGNKLREGMMVFIESAALRESAEKFFDENTSSYSRQRALETSRWCTVTDLVGIRVDRNTTMVSFIGVYSDGTKIERSANGTYCWFVKLDSIPTEEPVIPVPLGPLVIFDDQPEEDEPILDDGDIDEMDESFPHPDDTDVYKD